MNKDQITINKDQLTKKKEKRGMRKGIVFMISLFSVLFSLFFVMACNNPFWTLDTKLKGTITISPTQPKAGDTITITYTPGTGEPAFPGGYKIEIFKDTPPPGSLVSTTLPFMPTEPGPYTIKITDPVTGKVIEETFTVIAPGELTGTITLSPTPPESGDPVTVTYVPGTGEPAFPGEYQIEWFKESPPPAGNFVSESKANPFTPSDPGTYKVRVLDPATGKIIEQIVIINDPPLPNLTGDVGITGTGKTGDPLTGTYSGTESPVTYKWYREAPPPAAFVTSSNPFTPTVPGTYVVVTTVPGYNPKVSDPIIVEAPTELTGIIGISPTTPSTGLPVDIIYIPGPGEPANFPGGYLIEVIKDDPPPGSLVSTTVPFTPEDPGTYTIKITDPVTGKIIEETFTVDPAVLDELTGTINLSPVIPEKGTPVTVTYVPDAGEPAFPGTYEIEWFKESPPPSGSVSKANPFTPADPGTYKVRVSDPATGKVIEKVVVINDPLIPDLTGDVGITGTGKTGDPLKGTYSGTESPVTYEWYREAPPPATLVSKANPFTPTEPGTYVLIVTVDGYNPIVSDPITVTDTVAHTVNFVNVGGPSFSGQPAFNPQIITAGNTVANPGTPSASFQPANPLDTPTAGLWTPLEISFDGWYIQATDEKVDSFPLTITENTTLEARWIVPAQVPVTDVPVNNVNAAFSYISDAERLLGEKYVLYLSDNVNLTSGVQLTRNSELTIIGIGATRTITSTGVTGASTVIGFGNATNNPVGSNLIFGNNITLQGRTGGMASPLISISNGSSVTMLTGSRITGNTSDAPSVSVGVNTPPTTGTLNMKGGTIDGNTISGPTAAVRVLAGSTLDLTHTSLYTAIFSNSTNVNAPAGTIIIPGNARVQGGTVGTPTVSGTPTESSITVSALTVTFGLISGQTQDVEYAISLSDDGAGFIGSPAWGASTTFNGLSASTTYYVYARAAAQTGASAIHAAGQHQVSVGIATAAGVITPTAGNLYRGSPGNLTAHLMAVTTDAELNTAFTTHINSGTGEYTLYLGTNLNNTAQRTFAANQKLTIIGLGGERTIEHTVNNTRLFHLNGDTNTSLTLGDGVTLKGYNGSTTHLLHVEENGNLIMLDGSTITGHSTSHLAGGTVLIQGGSTFRMEGGTITGNNCTSSTPNASGGVWINTASFIMNGGSITNNRNTNRDWDRDMLISTIDAGPFNLSGSATIGHISLFADATNNTIINTTGAFTGSITHLYLTSGTSSLDTVKSNWNNKPVITGTNIAQVIAGIGGTSFFVGNTGTTESIAATHYIDTDGVLKASACTHNWNWIITTPPNFGTSTDGVETRTCTVCAETDGTRVYPILALGGTGPAGGKIIYIDTTGFEVTSTTAAFTTYTAYYLEAAPENAVGGTGMETTMRWTTRTTDPYPDLSATGLGIGSGRNNTALIIAAEKAAYPDDPYIYAALACDNYSHADFSDWFMPSRDELNQFYLRRGDFDLTTGNFWSSSQNTGTGAWGHVFSSNYQGYFIKNSGGVTVRPIRAF